MCVAYPVMEGPKGHAKPVLHYASIPLALADGDEQNDMHRYSMGGGKQNSRNAIMMFLQRHLSGIAFKVEGHYLQRAGPPIDYFIQFHGNNAKRSCCGFTF